MQNFSKKILIIILITLTGLVVFFVTKNIRKTDSPKPTAQSVNADSDEPRIVSTKPDPLNETIIPASQVIEITFNKPLQNVPEFKVRIEPKVDFKVELSFDRKTAKITPLKPLGLGTAYTLTINPDTKFDGVGNWGQTKDFHFRTIKYRGV